MPSSPRRVLAALDRSGEPYSPDPEHPLLTATDLGILRGEAVFETMRAYAGRAFLLAEHLDRMAASAIRVALTLPSVERLHAVVEHALTCFGPADASLRVVSTKGPEGARSGDTRPPGTTFALVSPVTSASERARRDGVEAVTLSFGGPAGSRPASHWALGGVKSTSYAPAMAALRAADAQGAEDAIYISSDGEVLEAPTASVVAVREGKIVTPPEDEVGILPSTTVGFFGSLIRRQRLTVETLRDADELMLLSSVRGVVPVLRLDGRPVGSGAVGPHTEQLRSRYEAAIRALR